MCLKYLRNGLGFSCEPVNKDVNSFFCPKGKLNDCLIVFGASWNTGMMGLQFGKKIGAKIIGVSKQHWITDFGADYVIGDYDKVVEKVDEITGVLNSIGVKTWDNSFASVGVNGRLVTYGILTRADVKLNIQSLYHKQIKLITGCNRKELQELHTTFSAKDLKVKVWKKFSIQDGRKALEALSDKEREGRILVEIKS